MRPVENPTERRARENQLRNFVTQKEVNVAKTWERARKRIKQDRRKLGRVGRIEDYKFDSTGRRVIELVPAFEE